MATPTSSVATQRPDLGASFEEFSLDAASRGFVAQEILPVQEVASQAGTFGVIPVEQLLQQPDTERAPGSAYNRGEFKFTPTTYACVEHGHEEPIDDTERHMYAQYFDHEMVSAARARDAVLNSLERVVAALVFDPTVWTGAALNTAVTNEWDDFTNATPITDINAAVLKVFEGSGLWPTTLTVNRKVFKNLRQCAQIIDRLKYSGHDDPKNVSAQALAQLFDLQEVIVAGAAKNTANQAQAAVIGSIWSDEYAALSVVDRSIDFKRPTVGRTFHWDRDGSEIGGAFESYRDESRRSDVVRVRHHRQPKILYVKAQHLLSNITT